MTNGKTQENILVSFYGGRLEYGGPEEGGWYYERQWLLPNVESLAFPDEASAEKAEHWLNDVYRERRKAWEKIQRSVGGALGLDRVWQVARMEIKRGFHEKTTRPKWDD